VRSRGPCLFRTAALLTHNEAAAHDLLVGALAQAQTTWKRSGSAPESFVRSIVATRFVRRRPAGKRAQSGLLMTKPSDAPEHATEPELGRPTSEDSHLRDSLLGMTGRQRAVAVLAAHHGQSLTQCAAALGISERATATAGHHAQDALGVDELGTMAPLLAEVAESFIPPDPESLLTDCAALRPRVQRRRAARWALPAGVVLAAGLAAVLLQDPDDPVSEHVDAAVIDAAYTDGFGLVDGTPAPFVDGLTLAKTEVIDYALRRRIVAAPKVDDATQVYAVAYCDLPGNSLDAFAILDAVSIKAGDDVVDLSCMDRSADTATAPFLAALPRGTDDYLVTVPSVWAGAGSVSLAFYTETPWADYPFQPSLAGAALPSVAARSSVDDSTPLTTDSTLEWLLGPDTQVRSIDVDIDTTLELTLLTDEPGQLLVALDGVVITNDGEALGALGQSRPGPWATADPAMRQGFWRGYSASGYYQRLDSATLAQLGVDITDDTVRLSVIPRGFGGTGWQVIATTDGGEGPMAVAPGYSSSLPAYAHGMRRVAAYQVPTDGIEHEVTLPTDRVDQITWVGACGVQTPYEIRTVALKTPYGNGFIPCASYRSEWSSPLTRIVGSDSPSTGSSSSANPAAISLTGPKNGDVTSVTIGAYEDVPYADFPFEVTDQPSTVSLDLRPDPDEGYVLGMGRLGDDSLAWTTTATVTDRYLDADGRVSLPAPASATSVVHVSGTGKGRFRVTSGGTRPVPLDEVFADPVVFGRVASPLNYRDGWWTSWTAASTDLAIPVPSAVIGSDSPLEVTVEGYGPGSLRIDVVEVITGDDTLDR